MAQFEDTTGREMLLKASGLKTGRVLDVGMGGCACMAFFLARQRFDVTGIDRSSRAVHEARQKTRKKIINGSFIAYRADASDMPFDDDVFDAVISFHSLHHMDKPAQAIREMFRVCRPGGMVLIADLNVTGRKLYKHKPDQHGLLQIIERTAKCLASGLQISDTRLDRLFICRKKWPRAIVKTSTPKSKRKSK